MDNEFTIKINGASSVLTYKDQLGTIKKKTVKTEELCRQLGSFTQTTDVIVPHGCRQIKETNEYMVLAFINPEFVGDHLLKWGSPEREEFGDPPDFIENMGDSIKKFSVPYPPSCSIVVVAKQKDNRFNFVNLYQYALDSYPLDMTKVKLYRWPFSNMYENGRCCIGNIVKSYTTIESLASIPTTIFHGVGNTDLSSVRTSKVAGYRNGYEVVKSIAGKTSFPKEVLDYYADLQGTLSALANKNIY